MLAQPGGNRHAVGARVRFLFDGRAPLLELRSGSSYLSRNATTLHTGTGSSSTTDLEVRWPGGARLAVNFVLNYEEGSEYSMGDGDGRSDAALTEVAQPRVPRGQRDLGVGGIVLFAFAMLPRLPVGST